MQQLGYASARPVALLRVPLVDQEVVEPSGASRPGSVMNVYPFIEAERAEQREARVRAARGLPSRLLPVGQARPVGARTRRSGAGSSDRRGRSADRADWDRSERRKEGQTGARGQRTHRGFGRPRLAAKPWNLPHAKREAARILQLD